jgi:hypothetical protein
MIYSNKAILIFLLLRIADCDLASLFLLALKSCYGVCLFCNLPPRKLATRLDKIDQTNTKIDKTYIKWIELSYRTIIIP